MRVRAWARRPSRDWLQHVVASVCDVRRAREERSVDKTGDMRRRAGRGEPISSIARAVGVSETTARKNAKTDDPSPEPRGGDGRRAMRSPPTRGR